MPQTAAAPAAQSPGAWARMAACSAVVAYALLGAVTALRHEPWADEAHGWLLARDASLYDLWTRLLHYEGTPGLWHTILHGLIQLHVPYAGLNFISLAAGIASALIVIAYAPWPLPVRITLPFTYYLFYQYAIIARSYALLPLLVFACAVAYSRSKLLFTTAAILLAAISLDGFILAVLFYIDHLRHERGGFRTAIFVAAIAGLGAAAWPARDNQFVTQLSLSFSHFREYSLAMVQYAFTGEWITTLAAIGLSVPILFKGRTVWLFAALAIGLCTIHSIVYMHVWHFGGLTLAWLYCLWIAVERNKRLPLLAAVSFALVITFQCYWTARTVYYDWNHAYSGSREAAIYIAQHPEIAGAGIRLTGFSDEAIKGYFTHRQLEQMTGATGPAYWDWSARNTANDTLPLFERNRPGYLIAGYKLTSEQIHWRRVAAAAGYKPTRVFKGNVYWRTEILEPESFDFYRRLDDAPGSHLTGALDLGDAAAEGQLLRGFYDSEAGWRWTARSFSFILKSPADAAVKGATLIMDLVFPENQIRDLGPLTLTAALGDKFLARRVFTAPGEISWTLDIPAAAFHLPTAAFYFRFDKARAPAGDEKRELAAIVKSIRLRSK